MAYKFQLGAFKLPDGASIDTTVGDMELGDKQVDSTDLAADAAKLIFAEMKITSAAASDHDTTQTDEGGEITFSMNSKFFKINFSDAADTAGFRSGTGADNANPFVMNVDTVAASRDVSAMYGQIQIGLQDATHGLAAKCAGGAKFEIIKTATGGNANKEISIRSQKPGATFDFVSESKNVSGMNALSVTAYSLVNLFNMSTDDVYASKTAAEVLTAVGGQASNAKLTELATMLQATADAMAELDEAEVQILDGATVSTAELNYVVGVTSAIQTQLGAKHPTIDGSARLSATLIGGNGDVSNAEFGHLDGVTSAIQTQINAKHPTINSSARLSATLVGANGNVSDLEFGHLADVTSAIQAQINAKAPLASPALTGNPVAPTAVAATNNTQIATTAYVTTAVANLVDTAPGTLNTLNELAAALGDDASFSTTVTNSIATKAPLANPTFTGEIGIGSVNVSETELGILEGLTVSTAELNELASNAVDGSDFTKLSEITATSAELNKLDKARTFQKHTAAIAGGGSIDPDSGHIVAIIPGAGTSLEFFLPEMVTALEGQVLRIKNAGQSAFVLTRHGNDDANSLEGANSVTLNIGAAISCVCIDTGTDAFEWFVM